MFETGLKKAGKLLLFHSKLLNYVVYLSDSFEDLEFAVTFAIRFIISIRDVAQPGSAHVWGAWGRWFESSHPDKWELH